MGSTVKFRTRNPFLSSLPALCFWMGLFSVPSSVWGQATTSLRGTVTDASGGAVANAAVVLTNSESKAERSTVSDSAGGYEFLFLPPGAYSLRGYT